MKKVFMMTAACVTAIVIGCASSALTIVGGELPAENVITESAEREPEQKQEQELEVKSIGFAAIESKAKEVETRSAVVRAASREAREAHEESEESRERHSYKDAEYNGFAAEDDQEPAASGSRPVRSGDEGADAEALDADDDSIFRRFTEEEIIFQEEEPMYDEQGFFEEPELEEDDTQEDDALNEGADAARTAEDEDDASYIGGGDDIDAEAMEADGMRAE